LLKNAKLRYKLSLSLIIQITVMQQAKPSSSRLYRTKSLDKQQASFYPQQQVVP